MESFFNFFSPPDVPGEDDEIDEEEMEELQAVIEADYEVRRGLKTHCLKNACGELCAV